MARRLYSLFRRPRSAAPGTPWTRVSEQAYTKAQATRVFQGRLLSSVLGGERPDDVGMELSLRPVTPKRERMAEAGA